MIGRKAKPAVVKKRKVAFAELPDLCVGDGYTQIAYNPQDVEKVKSVVESFKKKSF